MSEMHNFGRVWVRGVLYPTLRANLTLSFPPSLLKPVKGCPLKPLDFRNVSKASSVIPIVKPLGQGSSLVPLKTTFETWSPPEII